MKRSKEEKKGPGDNLKRPKLVIGKPGSKSRSRSTISRSSNKSGSPKGKRSKQYLLSGGEKTVSREFLLSHLPSVYDSQRRQVVKPCRIREDQQIHDKSQPRLSLCCHWKHCTYHRQLLQEHLLKYKDKLIPIRQYHGEACDGKECLKYSSPRTSQSKIEEKAKQAAKQTAVTQKSSWEPRHRTRADIAKETLDTPAPVSGKMSPSQPKRGKPQRKRPSQPYHARKEIPEVDISKMHYGTSLASTSFEPPVYQPPLDFAATPVPAPQTPTRKMLHVVKADVHHDTPAPVSGKMSPSQPKRGKPQRKRPSQPYHARKEIPEVDISKMHYGTSLASTSFEPPVYQPPLDFAATPVPAPQTPTRKMLHVVKADVHHDQTPVKPTKPKRKPAPAPQTQKDFDKIVVDTLKVPPGISKASTIRKGGKKGRSMIPVPVKTIKPEQKPLPPPSFDDLYYCPPSTSKETPVLIRRSPNPNVPQKSTKIDKSLDSEIGIDTSGKQVSQLVS